MNYFVRIDVSIRNDADLVLLLAAQKEAEAAIFIEGHAKRFVFQEKFDKFFLVGRIFSQVEAMALYAAFKKAMQTGTIPGWIAWHLCQHEEGINACSWNEEFTIPGGD